MEIFFYLCVVLLVVVLVGHSIWAFIAWMLRGFRRSHHRAHYEPTLSEDRAATARYLRHLMMRGAIDEPTHARLMRVLAESAHPAAAQVVAPRAPTPQAKTVVDEAAVEETPVAPVASPPAPVPKPRTQPVVVERPQPVGTHPATTPLPAPAPRPAVAPPPAPRRSFSEILGSFMAEKNIRWGEIIGGLLIVCCSAALVISLWSRIEAIPVLKFVIFTAVTAALFGAGLFVYHRWKIPTTGQVVLLVATLLVPLNMLAFAAFSLHGAVTGAWTVFIEVGAVFLFAWLAFLAARVVLPTAPVLFTGGIVGVAATALLVRLVTPLTNLTLFGMALIPLVLYGATMAVSLWWIARRQRVSDTDAKALFLQLGAQTFACLVPVGLMVYAFGPVVEALRVLAPFVCLLVGPALFGGVLVWRRLEHDGAAQLRTAAASITLIAAAIACIGVALAWPVPSRLIPAALVNGLLMVALSRLSRHPAIHALAVTWFTLAGVLGAHVAGDLHWATGTSEAVLEALLSARTGQMLVAAVAACAGIAVLHRRRRRPELTHAYVMTALGIAVISVALVTVFGFARADDPAHVTWVYLVYAIGAFVLATRTGSPHAVWCGAVLGQMAIAQFLVYAWPVQQFAWPTALLVGASLCAAGAATLRFIRVRPQMERAFTGPLAHFGTAVSVLAVAWLLSLSLPDFVAAGALALCLVWIAALWLVLSWVLGSSELLAAAQLALAGAACAGVQTFLRHRPWYANVAQPLTEPWVVQAHVVAIGSVCLAWAVVRVLINWRAARVAADKAAESTAGRSWLVRARAMLNPHFPLADHWMSLLVLMTLGWLSLWRVVPGIVAEHGWQIASASGGPHIHAAGAGSWLLFGVVAMTLSLNWVERRSGFFAVGGLLALACAATLCGAPFEGQHQVVLVLRWIYASVFVASFGVLGMIARRAIQRGGAHANGRNPAAARDIAAWLLLVLFAAPAVLLTLTFARAIGAGEALVAAGTSNLLMRVQLLGPAILLAIGVMAYGRATWRPGLAAATALYGVAIVTATELCMQYRAGLAVTYPYVIWLVQLNVLVSAAVALAWHLMRGGEAPRGEATKYPAWPLLLGRAAVGLVFVIVAVDLWCTPYRVSAGVAAAGTAYGVFAVVLVELALRIAAAHAKSRRDVDTGVWTLFAVVLIASALARFDMGNWLCYHALMVGLVLAGGARLFLGDRQTRQMLGTGWQETFETASAFGAEQAKAIDHDISCVGCGYNLRGLSPSGHCPECNASIADSVDIVLHRLTPQWAARLMHTRVHTAAAVLLCMAFAALFALRATFEDPQRPWWSVAALVASAALAMALAAWAPRRAYAFAAGAAACLATSIWRIVSFWHYPTQFSVANLTDLAQVNIVSLALVSLAWLVIERRLLSRKLADATNGGGLALHHFAGLALPYAILALAGRALLETLAHVQLAEIAALPWFAWGVVAVLVFACHRDAGFRHVASGLYTLGLAAVIQILAQVGLVSNVLLEAISLGLAGYVLLTVVVWRLWHAVNRDSTVATPGGAALLIANGLLASVSVLLALHLSFTVAELSGRLLVALSPALCAASMMVAAIGARRVQRQTIGLALVTVATVMLAWSPVAWGASAFLLQRAICTFAAVAVLMIAAGAGAALDSKRAICARRGEWAVALKHNVGGAAVLGGVALVYCIVLEIQALGAHEAPPLPTWSVAAPIVSLALLVVCCVAFAVRDRLDPLHLRATAREAYVYVGEWLAAALVLHVRATMPYLFSGLITQYWPILLMGLAFCAIAAGEVCARRGLQVIARPLGRTGTFLPALGLLELFLASSQVHFSVVLLTIGALYAVLAGLRRSVAMGLLAALALNASLWYLLSQQPGLGLTQHPQLWLIPPALAVLAAVRLTRERLGEEQRALLHYVCLLAVYLSSTADVFLIGVREAPWLPLVLGALSLTGILVGFVSRIRSFLFLGSGFLCLSLLTMIWHAAANLGWTWLWYVSGIVLGIGIITVFALFEKKRNEMNAWLDELREWAH